MGGRTISIAANPLVARIFPAIEGKEFNLAAALGAQLPRIDGHEIFIQIHNDAVVQGLSEVPNMTDISHWGVMTIGTGLGNARFTNRGDADAG